MAIRIKSERVHQLAKEVAAMTSETQVAAIERALERELAEVRRRYAEDNTFSHPPTSADERRPHE